MKRLIFDIETDNLYADVTKIHCIVTKDLDNGEITTYSPTTNCIKEGLKVLSDASLLVGHNIIDFDIPVIQKLYPSWRTNASIRDTLVISRLHHTELKRFDFMTRTDKGFPKKLAGSHSLEAWGYRLGNYKGQKPDSWEEFTPEMLEYCIQDVILNELLWIKFSGQLWKGECVQLEHEVAHIIQMQEKAGVYFDTKKAGLLHASLLHEQEEIGRELKKETPGWYKDKGLFVPKVNNKKQGYTKGCKLTKLEWIPFNPQSRQHLVRILKENHGWRPKKYTDAGNAIFNESVIKGLGKIKGADRMLTYLTCSKRISQLYGGAQAWLTCVGKDNIIHGRVNTNGAITGRMSHYRPNLSQVPAVYSPYGKECRELFTVRSKGNYLVGCDADGLELRGLANFLFPYDGGSYARAVLHGTKEEGTDAHSLTLRSLGKLCKDRDTAKKFFYALIYGAGDWKLGQILTGKSGNSNVRIGKAARARIENGIRGLGKLKEKISKLLRKRSKEEKRSYLTGLDGRKIFIRSEHAALNSLIQSSGGVLMKKALVILYNRLCKAGAVHGTDYWFVINSHDEWQIEITKGCDPHMYGNCMTTSMDAAGEHFNLNVPITGEWKVGKNWAQTH